MAGIIGTMTSYGSVLISQLNPVSWSQNTQTKAVRVVCVASFTFLGLSLLQRFPGALAAPESSKFIYDCLMPKELNAGKAYALVFAKTWDAVKASEASSHIYKVGKLVDALPSGTLFSKLCQSVADQWPLSY